MCIQIIQYISILLASFPGQLNRAASDVLLSVRYSYNDSQYSWHIFALFDYTMVISLKKITRTSSV